MLKRRLTQWLFFLVIGYFIYGLFISFSEFNVIPRALEPDNPPGFYDYQGTINIHTNQSTGTGSTADVIAAAQEADLDFIFITDYNSFEKDTSAEGYHDKLFVFIDGEYSYLDSRLLNLNATNKDHLVGPGQSQVLIGDLLSHKERDSHQGLFVLAHPTTLGFKWSGPYPPGLDGLEVINLKAIWQDTWMNSRGSFLWSLLIYPFNADLAFTRMFVRAGWQEIPLWDQLSTQGPVVGLAGSDAEQRIQSFGSYARFPRYATLFRMARNHILLRSELTGNPTSDREKIVEAVAKGQLYMSMDMLANPTGFNAVIEDSAGGQHPMGSSVLLQNNLTLKIDLPAKPLVPFEVVIFHNGSPMIVINSIESKTPITKNGVYRVVVKVKPNLPIPNKRDWIPWILTNNFYVN